MLNSIANCILTMSEKFNEKNYKISHVEPLGYYFVSTRFQVILKKADNEYAVETDFCSFKHKSTPYTCIPYIYIFILETK